ncbi:MAG: HD domain-containing phosphohydrolase [Phycisphaerales bacterium]|nr:HD domain-containing phosphohydrolase [Phycisphaerales bacterium]
MHQHTPIVTIPMLESAVLERIGKPCGTPPASCPSGGIELLDQLGKWDMASREHCGRVGVAADAFGRFLGLHDATLQTLSIAAHLHDVGKIRTPIDILTQDGPLSDAQYARVKCHAADGADLLAEAGLSAEVVKITRTHHEWWDGRGYPEGIAEHDIPQAARIIAIVDAWDAISARRSYHRRRPEFLALTEIRKGGGTQFDPELVQAFVDHVCERLAGTRRCA